MQSDVTKGAQTTQATQAFADVQTIFFIKRDTPYWEFLFFHSQREDYQSTLGSWWMRKFSTNNFHMSSRIMDDATHKGVIIRDNSIWVIDRKEYITTVSIIFCQVSGNLFSDF